MKGKVTVEYNMDMDQCYIVRKKLKKDGSITTKRIRISHTHAVALAKDLTILTDVRKW